jgi:hypothetical protein
VTYLGIDFGQRTGVCVMIEDGVLTSTFHLPEGADKEGARYVEFGRILGEPEPGARRVIFEEPSFHRGGAPGKQNAGYRAILMAWCELHNLPYASVPVPTLKAFARERTGLPCKGKLTQAAHAHAATEGHKLREIDDNAADAYWLAIYGRDALTW